MGYHHGDQHSADREQHTVQQTEEAGATPSASATRRRQMELQQKTGAVGADDCYTSEQGAALKGARIRFAGFAPYLPSVKQEPLDWLKLEIL